MPKGNGKSIPKVKIDLEPSKDQVSELFQTLQERFEANMSRHKGLKWETIQAKLEKKT